MISDQIILKQLSDISTRYPHPFTFSSGRLCNTLVKTLIYTFLSNVHLVPLFLKLTSFSSFIFFSTIIITDFTYLNNFGLYFEPYITNPFADLSFLHLSQVWRLWSSATSHGSVILLPSSVIHKCWYVDSKALFFIFFWIALPTWLC